MNKPNKTRQKNCSGLNAKPENESENQGWFSTGNWKIARAPILTIRRDNFAQ
jgi:hypothetical protein